MIKTCIIAADATRARFISVEEPPHADLDAGPHLLEHLDLVHPERDLPERELFSDRGGRVHGAPGGSAHGADDHRARHMAEEDRRFVQRILAEAERFARQQASQRVIFVMGSRLLGVLRSELGRLDAEIVEVPENLAGQSLTDLQEVLAGRGLVPRARPPRGAVYRSSGQPTPR